jgi:hypothetical protein
MDSTEALFGRGYSNLRALRAKLTARLPRPHKNVCHQERWLLAFDAIQCHAIAEMPAQVLCSLFRTPDKNDP